jgi:hypothetical protein
MAVVSGHRGLEGRRLLVAGKGVTAVGLAPDPDTVGYWILKSNGGIGAYEAPWQGFLAGKLSRGESVTGIAAAASPAPSPLR